MTNIESNIIAEWCNVTGHYYPLTPSGRAQLAENAMNLAQVAACVERGATIEVTHSGQCIVNGGSWTKRVNPDALVDPMNARWVLGEDCFY